MFPSSPSQNLLGKRRNLTHSSLEDTDGNKPLKKIKNEEHPSQKSFATTNCAPFNLDQKRNFYENYLVTLNADKKKTLDVKLNGVSHLQLGNQEIANNISKCREENKSLKRSVQVHDQKMKELAIQNNQLQVGINQTIERAQALQQTRESLLRELNALRNCCSPNNILNSYHNPDVF